MLGWLLVSGRIEFGEEPPAGLVEVGTRAAAATTAIVFVHGVMGDSKTTWKNGETNAYWPQLVRDDTRAFGRADVFTYEYASRMLSASPKIFQVAQDLELRLAQLLRERNYQNLVFIAHSMGGLVVRSMLRESGSAPRVRAVFYYATPTAGSEVSDLGSLLSSNPQFIDLHETANDGNSWLQELTENWNKRPHSFASFCAYETRKLQAGFLGWAVVVPSTSATFGCGLNHPVDADHSQIVKPRDANGASHLWFKEKYLSLQLDFPTSEDLKKAHDELRKDLHGRLVKAFPRQDRQDEILLAALRNAIATRRTRAYEQDAWTTPDIDAPIERLLDDVELAGSEFAAPEYADVRKAFSANQLDNAWRLLQERQTSAQAELAKTKYLMAIVDRARFDVPNARQLFADAVALDPSQGKYALELGRLEEQQTHRAAARLALQEAERRYSAAHDDAGRAQAALALLRVEVESRNHEA
ncbi:MAG TPA: hypothetical protein VI299_20940, partial [Polyangiales bacterium]